ncbi:enoyl-CoA hydratase [Pigmentiphaga sp. H8]|uniref:enoyl-CoA hydratase n=1 Tax=unclassified Pigmentiphaga TaxID=2626614 RepID=UPI000F5A06E0|nr:enoyl-CoA hydratase [Pigmentiphaga sp. H8]AZG11501.1 enoyl-CoA hydratase [Pigmentiphaga sp. H8]
MTRQRLLQDEICDQLIVEKDGPTGWITFNDPDRHNAVSYAMWAAIPVALDAFLRDPGIRSVVLTGAGEKAFVSGANISQFDALRTGTDAVEQYEVVAEAAQLALRDFPKPLLARIHGYCIGGGLNIALCCDLRIASEASSFSIPAGKLGLGYRFTAIQNLVRATGTANALEIFLTADRFPAGQAREKGLLHAVAPREDLDACLAGYLDKINALAPLTLQAGKKMIHILADRCADIDLDAMKALVVQCFDSDDYKEGKKAFAEKRRPVFKGR